MSDEISSSTSSSFTFSPVKVSRGRKWRGELAYFISSYDSTFSVYNGRGGIVRSETAKLWDPSTQKIVYANADFCEDVQVDQTKLNEDRKTYIDQTINGTIEWCRSQKPSSPEAEVLQFARNVLRKHHPEMMSYINEAAPDQRDVAAEVEKTLSWALTLKSRPCTIYGKYCPGGKLYPVKKQLSIARAALAKKGIVQKEGFEEIWKLNLVIRGLEKYSA